MMAGKQPPRPRPAIALRPSLGRAEPAVRINGLPKVRGKAAAGGKPRPWFDSGLALGVGRGSKKWAIIIWWAHFAFLSE